jgi:hypothetical protein
LIILQSQRIAFAKESSDSVAKKDGTQRPKRKRAADSTAEQDDSAKAVKLNEVAEVEMTAEVEMAPSEEEIGLISPVV